MRSPAMPAYLVHGVPDTARLWRPLRARLARTDVVAPDLPGFGGAPLPAAFGATADEYAAWLVADIERLGAPVDLVGHDWGSILSQRVAALRPDLVRTLACGAGPVDAEYRWHDMAVVWQTPGAGEQMMEAFGGEAAAAALAAAGVPPEHAGEVAARIDAVMKDCILRLYRSAVAIGERWQPAMHAVRGPTLAVWAADDPFVDLRFGERLAARVGGTLLRLDGGHWWPLARPGEVAEALAAFWARA
jgi:pimeloyl-ACP methyl ester carboxylesterase